MTRATPTPTRVRWDDMPCLHPHAAGMDLGASASVVAVPLLSYPPGRPPASRW
ncbi:MAG: hypothetical protein ACRERE_06945 [Candidatus Entotheonellia bacterium]